MIGEIVVCTVYRRAAVGPSTASPASVNKLSHFDNDGSGSQQSADYTDTETEAHSPFVDHCLSLLYRQTASKSSIVMFALIVLDIVAAEDKTLTGRNATLQWHHHCVRRLHMVQPR